MTDAETPQPYTLFVHPDCVAVPIVRDECLGLAAQGARVLVSAHINGPHIPLWQWLMQRRPA